MGRGVRLGLAGESTVVLKTRKTGTGDRLPRRAPITPDLAGRLGKWRKAQPIRKALYVLEQGGQAKPHQMTWAVKHLKMLPPNQV